VIDLLRFLHVLSMALWIGAALWLAGDVRRTMALGQPHVMALAARAKPSLGLDAVAGVATLVTGLALMLALGMTRPRFGIAAGFVLALLRLGVLAALRGTFGALARELRHGEDVPPYDHLVRRMAMLSGIAHTLWLLALAGMIFPL
jgi:hypothetical protein